MKFVIALTTVVLALPFTWMLVAKMPYTGPVTEMYISDGPDLNVPYHDKYGLLGYAYARDFYQNGTVAERRIETLTPWKLALSSALVSLIWLVAGVSVVRALPRGRRATASAEDG